jgi:hypothetical protein
MGAARISAEAFCQAIRDECKAEPHPVLAPEPVWRDDTAASAAARANRVEYAQLGWLNRRGQLAGHVLDTLSVLAHPSAEYYGLYRLGADTTAVVVAVGEVESVLARREDDTITVVTLGPNESPSHAFVRELPDHQPAHTDAVNVRLSDLAPDNPYPADRRARDDARKLRFLAEQPAIGQGELWVAVRDHRGARRVCPTPVRYLDLSAGRLLITMASGYVSMAPASKELLRSRLTEARRALTG